MAILNIAQFQFQTQPDPNKPGHTLLSMQPGGHALFAAGATVDISIGCDKFTVETRKKNNQPIPLAKTVKAIIDTGCNVTSIDQSLLSELGLKIRGFVSAGTAGGAALLSQHTVELGFPGTQLRNYPMQLVNAVNLIGQPIKVLIGRDILANWILVYNGPFATVSISD